MSELTECQAVSVAKLCYHLWLCEEALPSLHLHNSKDMLNVCIALQLRSTVTVCV